MVKMIGLVVLLSFVVMVALGCSGPESMNDLPEELNKMEVFTAYNAGSHFPDVGTFTFMRDKVRYYVDERLDRKRYDQMLQRTIEAEMAKKGYAYAPSGRCTLLVGYVIALDKALDDRELNRLYSFNTGWMPGAMQSQAYEKGMMIMDILDGRTRLPIWRGAIRVNVDLELNDKIRKERAEAGVAALLYRFPPK